MALFCEFLTSLISRVFLFRYVDLWDEFSKNANERNLNDCDSESNSSGSSAWNNSIEWIWILKDHIRKNYDLTTFYLLLQNYVIAATDTTSWIKFKVYQKILYVFLYLAEVSFVYAIPFSVGKPISILVSWLFILIKQLSKSHNRNGDRRRKLRWVLYL